MKKDLRESILSQVSELEIFSHYLGKEVKLGRPIVSPLRQEKHPSFNLYQSPTNGKIYYKDFGDERGDCFKFVMELFGCTFPEALQIVCQDFGIESGQKIDKKIWEKTFNVRIPQIFINPRKEFPYSRLVWGFSTYTKSLWPKGNVTEKILLEYNVWPVFKMKIKKRDSDEWFVLESSPEDPIYCFDYENGVKKFYRPNVKDKKYKFISNLRTGDIFGLKQLKNYVKKVGIVDVVIICAGQKDCLSLYGSTGIRGVALNSESASVSKELLIELLQYAKNILVCYDNDATGIKNAAKIKEEIGINNISLGDISSPDVVNDIYDYFSKGFKKEKFMNLIYEKIL
jgi:hypothetical protein